MEPFQESSSIDLEMPRHLLPIFVEMEESHSLVRNDRGDLGTEIHTATCDQPQVLMDGFPPMCPSLDQKLRKKQEGGVLPASCGREHKTYTREISKTLAGPS